MSGYIGDFSEDATVRISFTTHTSTGALVAPSAAFTASDFRVYKNGGATEKTTTNGITVTSPFDSIVGKHQIDIDTSNDTGDAGFWATGSDYRVEINSAKTVDSVSQSGVVVGRFSIQNRYAAPTAAVIADAVWDEATSEHTTTNTFGASVGTLLSKLSGITSLGSWLRIIMRGDVGDAVAMSEINTGGGTYDPELHSLETAEDSRDAIAALVDALEQTGSGSNTVNVTLSDDSDNRVAGSVVNVQNAAGAMLGIYGTTDADGEVTFYLDDGSYLFVVTDRSGYETHTPEAVTVDEDPEAVGLTVTVRSASTPSDPGLCAVDCYVRLNGAAVQGAIIKARLIDANQAVDGVVLSTAVTEATTDADGLATLELVRLDQFIDGDGEYKIEAWHGSYKIWEKVTTIPNASSANLEDLHEDA